MCEAPPAGRAPARHRRGAWLRCGLGEVLEVMADTASLVRRTRRRTATRGALPVRGGWPGDASERDRSHRVDGERRRQVRGEQSPIALHSMQHEETKRRGRWRRAAMTCGRPGAGRNLY